MSSIQEAIDEGKSVSDIFASASASVQAQYDPDELDAEIDALLRVPGKDKQEMDNDSHPNQQQKQHEQKQPKKGVDKKSAVLG